MKNSSATISVIFLMAFNILAMHKSTEQEIKRRSDFRSQSAGIPKAMGLREELMALTLNSFENDWLGLNNEWQSRKIKVRLIVSKIYPSLDEARAAYELFRSRIQKHGFGIPPINEEKNFIKIKETDCYRIIPSIKDEHFPLMKKLNARMSQQKLNNINNKDLVNKLVLFEDTLKELAKCDDDNLQADIKISLKKQFPKFRFTLTGQNYLLPDEKNINFILRCTPGNQSSGVPYIFESVLSLEEINKITKFINDNLAEYRLFLSTLNENPTNKRIMEIKTGIFSAGITNH